MSTTQEQNHYKQKELNGESCPGAPNEELAFSSKELLVFV